MTKTATTQTKVFLTKEEILQQEYYAAKFYELIQQELRMKDLANIDNITSYSKSFKLHSTLAHDGYFYL